MSRTSPMSPQLFGEQVTAGLAGKTFNVVAQILGQVEMKGIYFQPEKKAAVYLCASNQWGTSSSTAQAHFSNLQCLC